jgi:hypothetical protein
LKFIPISNRDVTGEKNGAHLATRVATLSLSYILVAEWLYNWAAIASAFYLTYPVGIILGSLNLLLGLLFFLGITRDPTAERIFFEGPRPSEEGLVEIGCLWALPVSFLLFGLWLWVLIFFVRFISSS